MLFSCYGEIENYKKIISSGFDRIILSGKILSQMTESKFNIVEKIISNGSLKCQSLNDFCSPNIKLCGNDYNISIVKSYSEILLERAAKLGVKNVGIGAPQSRSISNKNLIDLEMDRFKESLFQICEIAKFYNIDILLEAINSNECNFINYTEEALMIINTMHLDNLHLVYDIYHAELMKESEKALINAINQIKLVHVACEENNKRQYPSQELIKKYLRYIEALMKNDYSEEIGIEVMSSDNNIDLKTSLETLKVKCFEFYQTDLETARKL